MIIREALAEGSALLARAGIESPSLDASLLLAEALGVSRSALIAAGADPLPEKTCAVFQRLLERRRGGECAAYITGRKEFYGLDFTVSQPVLVPRPDTETLVEAALEELKFFSNTSAVKSLRALDLCTGSGAAAIALKHELPALEMWAADISGAALAVAAVNAERLLPPPPPVHFCQGDLFDALPPALRFNIITANPPYIPSAEIETLAPEVRREPRIALDGGADGLSLIRRIIARAPAYLCSGGVLLLEADPRQMKAIAALFETAGFTNIKTRHDLSGRERVIAGGKASLP